MLEIAEYSAVIEATEAVTKIMVTLRDLEELEKDTKQKEYSGEIVKSLKEVMKTLVKTMEKNTGDS